MALQLFQDVVVNGEILPASIVAAETQNHAGARGAPRAAWWQAADAIAIRTVLLQEARRLGLNPDPEAVAPDRTESDEESIIRQLLDQVIDTAPPDKAAVHREWRKDPTRFRSPPLWEVSHILVACDGADAAERADAERRASAIFDALIRDPASFASIAERESDCPSKRMGGFLGQMRPGDVVPEFEAVLSEMTAGEIGGPVFTRYGYHVIRLDAVAEGRTLPFDAIAGKIAEAMEKAAWARAAQAYVRRLLRDAEISGAPLSSR